MINPESFKTVAIIPAAGSGIRMETKRAKQFLSLDGKPILALALEPFQEGTVDAIVLVVPKDDVEYCRKEIVEKFGFTKVDKIVPGGKRRQDSVRLGLEATEGKYDVVLIHDGVRPLVEKEVIEKVIEEAMVNRAVITALPAKETVKEVNDLQHVVKTYDRKRVWMVQTPQAFRYQDILKAHRKALKEGWEEATDDALLVEKSGLTVKVIEGSEKNIKVTTPHDLELARFWLRS
jgi:2-C-methyl-D-erythritol 4-phosphate cytidylyltransferase